MTATVDSYVVASGQPIYGGRAAPVVAPQYVLDKSKITVSDASSDANPYDSWFASQIAAQNARLGYKVPVEFVLHGSSGGSWPNGRMYTAIVDGAMSFPEATAFKFGAVTVWDGTNYHVELRPVDVYAGAGGTNESSHLGFVRSDGLLHLISEHRYDAYLAWQDDPTNADMSQFDLRKRVLSGVSMGAWGTATFGPRRYDKFAALYADRPRVRYSSAVNTYNFPVWGTGRVDFAAANVPQLAAGDGTGSAGAYTDLIAYVSNPANKMRWLGWCGGRNDGYFDFSDYIALVDAMRAAGRGFAFYWNNGDHVGGSIMDQIKASYPVGTFSRDYGYPLFTEHSLDNDPRVDLVGSINGGLSFRNVVESASGWSCQVTSIRGACTVKVKPVSEVYTANVAAKTVNIPAANTWVNVQFP